jgi:hypothetical protein
LGRLLEKLQGFHEEAETWRRSYLFISVIFFIFVILFSVADNIFGTNNNNNDQPPEEEMKRANK